MLAIRCAWAGSAAFDATHSSWAGWMDLGTCPPSPPPSPSPPSGSAAGATGTDGSATATIVLTLTASGSVSDYSDTKKAALRDLIAASAGVEPSMVSVTITAASVIITATITAPASDAAKVQTSLSTHLGTADAASEALGITVESNPTISTSGKGDSDSSSIGAIIGGAGEQHPCNLAPARTPPVLPQERSPVHLAPRAACPAHSRRLACALLLHRNRRLRLRQNQGENPTRLHRRRPSAGRRDPVCAREQDLKRARRASHCDPYP